MVPRRRFPVTRAVVSHGLSAHLEIRHVQLLVVPGNHDGNDAINGIPTDSEGVHRFDDRIGFLPRGWRARTTTGVTVAALGGANSIDVGARGQQLFEDSLWTGADIANLPP